MRVIAIISVLAMTAPGCGWSGRRGPEPTLAEQLAASRRGRAPASSPATAPAASVPATGGPDASRIATSGRATTTAPHDGPGIETAVLQVNAEFITPDDVLKPIRERLRRAAAAGGRPGDVARRIRQVIRAEIGRQVERLLLLSEAQQRLGDAALRGVDREVREEYRRALAESGGSKTALAERLTGLGTDLETWLGDLRTGLMIQTYIYRRLASKVHITRPMMWDYYQDHPKKYETSDRVTMRIVLVELEEFLPANGGATEAQRRQAVKKARAKIDAAAAEVRAGKDFAEVAKAHSTGPMASAGGVWPEMDVGSFRAEEVQRAAFNQEVGRVAGPIETSQGFYLVKTLGRRRGERRPFPEVQDEIRLVLRQRQYERLAADYLKRLRNEAMIVGLERFEQTVAMRAAREALRPESATE